MAACLLLLSCSYPLAAELWTQMFRDQLEEARAGDPDAQYEVGIMYLKGQGTRPDRDAAIKWLRAAATEGVEQAGERLHRMEENERRFARRLKQAQAGDADARYDVALMYIKGKGVAVDQAQARKWLEQAVAQGHSKAASRLGILYFKGEAGRPDYLRARKLFESVSADNVLAQYYLGEMYANGKGVKQDARQAIAWYRKAAEGGFHRAMGKVINLEEELKMQQRRRQRLAQEAASRAPAPAVVASAPAKAASPAKKAPEPAAPAPASGKSPVAVKKGGKARGKPVPASPIDRLAARRWTRNGKDVDFLPSAVTECERDKASLVCFSKELDRVSGGNRVHYRVKSVITPAGKGFRIAYQNLVLDVTVPETDAAGDVLGYDDEAAQGYSIRTGWTNKHKVRCTTKGARGLECVKDGAHHLTLRAR